MRAAPLAMLVLAAAVCLAGCGEPPVPQVRATFVPGTGDTRTPTAGAGASREPVARTPSCDVQNSTLQDSGLPLLQVSPAAPRPGERVIVRADRLAPGARTLTLLAPFQLDQRVTVTVTLDGRLDATFTMPPLPPGLCAMLVLDGTGAQSLGFLVGE